MILIVANRATTYNAAIHGAFLNACPEKCAFYGPTIVGVDRDRCLTFDENVHVDQIAKQVNASLIVIYRGSFADTNWIDRIPSVPYVLIDVDFCYLRSRPERDLLHEKAAIHFLRHPSDLRYSLNCSAMCMPFSIDPKIYTYAPWAGREQRVCFSGSSKAEKAYSVRRRAMDILHPIKSKYIRFQRQAKFYQQYMAGLTCNAGPWKYLNAKHFEIPACGTVLFTPGNNGVEQYLPAGTYVTYRSDCADLAEKWLEVQTHQDDWAARAKVAAKYVHDFHSHATRWRQFFKVLKDKNIYNGGNT